MSKRKAPYRHKDGSACWTKNCTRDVPRPVRTIPVRNVNGLSTYQTEQIGISAEVAIADAFNVPITDAYRGRGVDKIYSQLTPLVKKVLNDANVPKPVAHIAEGGNPVDFMLEGDKTLSVKTNMRNGSMIAPQVIGQPTASVFWQKFPELIPSSIDLNSMPYEEQAKLFKVAALANADRMLTKYWGNLFDCDYLVYTNNIVDRYDEISSAPNTKIYSKANPPVFDVSKISFTQDLSTWNESNTIKYDGIAIGEWQIHSNRDCFKFRFNLKGLEKAGLL